MNEKSVKVEIDFNEALRRIAITPKGAVVPQKHLVKEVGKEKAAPLKRKGATKVNQSK